MEPEAIDLLQNEWARRLVAAWPLVPKRARTSPDRDYAWAEASGLALDLVEIHGEPLVTARICTKDGVDPQALGLVKRMAVESTGLKRPAPRE